MVWRWKDFSPSNSTAETTSPSTREPSGLAPIVCTSFQFSAWLTILTRPACSVVQTLLYFSFAFEDLGPVCGCGYTGYVGGTILESSGKHPRVCSCLECYHLFRTHRHKSTTQGVSLPDTKSVPNLYVCHDISIDTSDKKFKMQLTHQDDYFYVIRSDPL
jgi:hypothetical protein